MSTYLEARLAEFAKMVRDELVEFYFEEEEEPTPDLTRNRQTVRLVHKHVPDLEGAEIGITISAYEVKAYVILDYSVCVWITFKGHSHIYWSTHVQVWSPAILDAIRRCFFEAYCEPIKSIARTASPQLINSCLQILEEAASKDEFIHLLGWMWFYSLVNSKPGYQVESFIRDIWRIADQKAVSYQEVDDLEKRIKRSVQAGQVLSE